MAMLYSAGRFANLAERALTVTLSPAVDSLFPVDGLRDGRASRATRHGSNGANPSITFDLAAFTPSSAGTYDIPVRAGERRRITGVGTTTISVQNLSTGKYLTAGGAWQAGATNCLSAAGALNYQVESLTLCLSPTVTLRIVMSGGTTVCDWPVCNAIWVWGHNLDPALSVQMRSSTDNFSGSDVLEASGSIQQPSFLILDSTPSYNRYVRLAFTGTNQAAPWYAEVSPCYVETAVTTLGMDPEVTYDFAQIRNEGPYSEPHVYPLADRPRRLCKWRFNMDVAREREIREEVILRCLGGAYPLMLVPTSTDTVPAVLFGKLDAKWSATRNFLDLWGTDLVLSEGVAPKLLA